MSCEIKKLTRTRTKFGVAINLLAAISTAIALTLFFAFREANRTQTDNGVGTLALRWFTRMQTRQIDRTLDVPPLFSTPLTRPLNCFAYPCRTDGILRPLARPRMNKTEPERRWQRLRSPNKCNHMRFAGIDVSAVYVVRTTRGTWTVPFDPSSFLRSGGIAATGQTPSLSLIRSKLSHWC
jgi:hypothetical protein